MALRSQNGGNRAQLIILGDVFDSNPCASSLSWLSSSQSYLFDFSHSRHRVQEAQAQVTQ